MIKNVKRTISFILIIAIMTMYSVPAIAASNPGSLIFDISEGNITLSSGTNANTIKVSYGAAQTLDNIPKANEITIIGTTTTNKVEVDGVTAHVTLDGADIQLSSSNSAFHLKNGANVTLTLTGSNILKSTGNGYGGLNLGGGQTATIQGTGSLTAAADSNAAAIGKGSNDTQGGTINILSGTVNASSGSISGAGIGGTNGGNGGTINISGGVVNSSSGGAGIGGGSGASGGNITISGGTVSATSTSSGAGIGGGIGGSGGTITISGGTVTATGSNGGAGIGGGKYIDAGYTGAAGTINITGDAFSEVTAYGGRVNSTAYGGAGIGAGCDSTGTFVSTGSISISAFSSVRAASYGVSPSAIQQGLGGTIDSYILMANFSAVQPANTTIQLYDDYSTYGGGTTPVDYKSLAITMQGATTYWIASGNRYQFYNSGESNQFNITATGITVFNNVVPDPDIAKVAADIAALTANNIKGTNADLSHVIGALANPLPATGSVNGSTITWASDKPAVVSDDGQTVVRPAAGESNATVNLTATVKKGTVTDTKDFTLTVLAETNSEAGYTYTLDSSNNATITDYTGAGGDVIIPDTLGGHPVKAIGSSAFSFQATMTSITIPDSVTSIGDNAFAFGNLTSAYFEGNAPTMGSNVFAFNSGDFTIYYLSGKTGFTNPWHSYTTSVKSNYSITYNGNTSTGGSVPTDAETYSTDDNATVLGNTGNLVKTGYTFDGWNTAANGSGTAYDPDDTLVIGSANVTLYAQWKQNSSQNSSSSVPGTLQFSAATFNAYEGSSLGVTVIRKGGSDGEVGVSWSLTGATADVDFTGSTSGTLTFADGEYSKTITLAIVKDKTVETSDTLSFTLSNATGGATLGTQKTASAKITDYIEDTTKLKNTVKTLKAVNRTIELNPGTSTQGQLLVTLSNKAIYNPAPSDATWKTSNANVATISNGVITAVGFGKATITATYGSKSATFAVNTMPKTLACSDSKSNAVTSSTTIKKLFGQTEELTLKSTDFEGTVTDITDQAVWSSSNTKAVTVDKGVITTTQTAGQSTITATYGGNKIRFKVSTTLKSLTSSAGTSEIKLKPGDATQKITISATFADDSKKDVSSDAVWKSQNTQIATVSNGVITAGATSGKTKVSVTYGGKTIFISVNTSLTLSSSNESVTLSVGGTSTIKITATYTDGTIADVTSSVTWSTSSSSVATVSEGKITGAAKGRTTITASYKGKKITIKVDVK